ncbi:MAG TPA: hypothetical protein VEU08_07545 [Vicinamibacterales bacterium]|nr:hypothetical protein [Vicinamibacterales bacterium]
MSETVHPDLAAYYATHAPVRAAEDGDGEPSGPSLDHEDVRPSNFAEWFAISQTLLPALLLVPGSQTYRFPLRVGAYAISLVAFVLWWFGKGGRQQGKHPAEKFLLMALLVVGLSIAHPNTSNLLAGVAQTMLYFAIFCPLFWARGYVTTRRQLVRVLVVLLICNGLNSIVGVLQVYDPNRWMPTLSEFYAGGTAATNAMRGAVTYTGPNGQEIIRPPGLFDTPGAVCGAGTIAALLGLIFFLEPLAWWKRLVALAMSGAGIAAIYLSHVRVSFVITLGMMTAYAAMLALQNQKARVTKFVGLGAGIVVGSFVFAVALGGTDVSDRFASLFAEDPRSLYYASRGQAVEYAFTNLLTEYPLGAGLGRWGMMRYYFGSASTFDSNELFAEVQPNAWILDGGVFLLALYFIALVTTVAYDLKFIQTLRDPEDRLWAAAVIAANFGTLPLVFSFVPFGTATGLQFWFLEGCLHGAMANRPRRS